MIAFKCLRENVDNVDITSERLLIYKTKYCSKYQNHVFQNHKEPGCQLSWINGRADWLHVRG